MSKPVLYLDIVGTLLLDRGSGMEIAPFAKKFLESVRGRFELRFLTSLEEHHAMRVSRALEIEIDYVPFRHALGKTSAIDFSENFFWVDDDPSPADLLRLSDERCSERLIPVTRREGITDATLKKLLSTLEECESQTI